jgi:hypothetical protein
MTVKARGWDNIVYVDESSFASHSYRPYGWAEPGQEVYGNRSGNNRPRINLIAAHRRKTFSLDKENLMEVRSIQAYGKAIPVSLLPKHYKQGSAQRSKLISAMNSIPFRHQSQTTRALNVFLEPVHDLLYIPIATQELR